MAYTPDDSAAPVGRDRPVEEAGQDDGHASPVYGAVRPMVLAAPLIPVGAFVLATIYGFGLFFPFGGHWLSALTFADVLALTWTMLPASILMIITAYLLIATLRSRLTFKSVPPKRSADLVWALLALAGMIGQFSVMVLAASYGGVSPVWYLISQIGIQLAVLGLTAFAFRNGGPLIFTLIIVYGAVWFSLNMGMTKALGIMTSNNQTTIEIEGRETVCTSLIFFGERGAIFYDRSPPEVSFVPREKITRYSLSTKPCVAKAAPVVPPRHRPVSPDVREKLAAK